MVEVDSIKDKNLKEKGNINYILLPSNDGVDINDLKFKEYSDYVRIALSKQVFIESSPDSAEIAIFFSYGIGDPKEHTYSYTYPIIGKQGGDKTNINARIYNSDGSSSRIYGTTYSKPKYGVTGYVSGTSTYTTYFRYATLEAIDLEKFRKIGESITVWQTNLTSTGSGNDLRVIMPVMIAASIPYLGKDSGKMINVKLTEKDYDVLQIKGMKINPDVTK